MYSVEFSDGIRQSKQFKTLKAAQVFVAGLLCRPKEFPDAPIKVKFVEIFKNGYRSTTQFDYLIEWFGPGYYWDNLSKNDPRVLNKKIEANTYIIQHRF